MEKSATKRAAAGIFKSISGSKALGKVPTVKELDEHSKFKAHHYKKKFGSHKKFLKAVGERSVQEQLIEEYIAVKEKLGRQPTALEFSKFSSTVWNRVAQHFGSWNDFLIAIGETPLKLRSEARAGKRNISEQDLIDAYYRLKEKLGRQPTIKDIDRLGEFSINSYTSHW